LQLRQLVRRTCDCELSEMDCVLLRSYPDLENNRAEKPINFWNLHYWVEFCRGVSMCDNSIKMMKCCHSYNFTDNLQICWGHGPKSIRQQSTILSQHSTYLTLFWEVHWLEYQLLDSWRFPLFNFNRKNIHIFDKLCWHIWINKK
jgi:hypothetical protein